MRQHGTLARWNEQRGFGFIAPAGGRADVFVHISAFPRDGSPPSVGELLSFEIGKASDGRPRAVKVMRAGAPRPATASNPRAPRPRRASIGPTVAIVFGTLVAATIVFRMFPTEHRIGPPPAAPATTAPRTAPASAAPRTAPAAAPLLSPPAESSTASFRCDGRTSCGQMSSCAEATYFLRNCPNTTMDGDHDGVPCEQQWCR